MKSESQDEKISYLKFIFGSLIIDETIFCKLNTDKNKSVYKILSTWIENYEKELKQIN